MKEISVRILGGLFLCSMQNGAISAYHSATARQAFKKIPPLPRTTELIGTIQLSRTKVVTLDTSKQYVPIDFISNRMFCLSFLED